MPAKKKKKLAPNPVDVATHATESVRLDDIRPHPRNYRAHPEEQLRHIEASLREHGFYRNVVVAQDGTILAGHGVVEAARRAGIAQVPIFRLPVSPDSPAALKVLAGDNELGRMAESDPAALDAILRDLAASADGGVDALLGTGFDASFLAALEAGAPDSASNSKPTNTEPTSGQLPPSAITPQAKRVGSLQERFGVAPFSVLNAREGWWQARKAAWIGLGIASELGRGENALFASERVVNIGSYRNERKAAARSFNTDALLRGQRVGFASPGGGGFQAGGTGSGVRLTDAFVGKRGRKANAVPGGSPEPLARAKNARLMGQNGPRPAGSFAPAGSFRELYAGGDAWRSGARGAECRPPEGEYDYPVDQLQKASGTSIFDPVLCELAYRWFCPPGGRVLDPFAGGSVRGIVAAVLGRQYIGVDLRPEQVAANEQQWAEVLARPVHAEATVGPDELTPVQEVAHGGGRVWVKRDDLCEVAGVRGGKVRSCWRIAQGAAGLVTAGSRASPQVCIVAHVASVLNIPCRAHVPSGELSPEVDLAASVGAEVVQHRPGYNTVIVARAREDAAASGWREVPFGMECAEAVEETSRQVANIPSNVERLVVPVGSGMSLAGILHGLARAGRSLPVLGVVVGADPRERLEKWAPQGWEGTVELVDAGVDYHEHVDGVRLGSALLDPVYEAKCLSYVRPGDCLWVVGARATALGDVAPARFDSAPVPRWLCGDSTALDDVLPGDDEPVDFVFSCPPYADLEVYSDDPRDLSTMSYDGFRLGLRASVAASVARLRDDRFACFVVGEVRDERGFYRGLVPDTIAAFEAAGARFYNEAILVTACGSLPVRARRPFESSRKLGKTHQNVLVFVKGDPKKAAEAVGEPQFGELFDEDTPEDNA